VNKRKKLVVRLYRPSGVLSDKDREYIDTVTLRIALGGWGAKDLREAALLPLSEASVMLAHCYKIANDPQLQQMAEAVVMIYTVRLALGKPAAGDMCNLIAEWCMRNLAGRSPGRPRVSYLNRVAVQWEFIRRMVTNPNEPRKNMRKNIIADLKTEFKLSRSQVYELLNGIDPKKYVEQRPSD
jgi:hypothetical protein